MDRCALFVDASYALAEGAQTVHGTRNRDSVSWDYPGLVKLLGSLSRDRTGLPLLRCYWYDTSADGNRAAEHDALADIPGVKLRLSKIRPNRKEGVEAEIRKDLTALARNHAVSDVVIVSAEEDLAPVIAEVQDLGIRATLLTITAADGSWVVSGPLRQECDDLIEMSGAHLRPYVDLISGAEPQLAAAGVPRADGHLRAGQRLSARYRSSGAANLCSPVAAEFEPAVLGGPRALRGAGQREQAPARTRPGSPRSREHAAAGGPVAPVRWPARADAQVHSSGPVAPIASGQPYQQPDASVAAGSAAPDARRLIRDRRIRRAGHAARRQPGSRRVRPRVVESNGQGSSPATGSAALAGAARRQFPLRPLPGQAAGPVQPPPRSARRRGPAGACGPVRACGPPVLEPARGPGLAACRAASRRSGSHGRDQRAPARGQAPADEGHAGAQAASQASPGQPGGLAQTGALASSAGARNGPPAGPAPAGGTSGWHAGTAGGQRIWRRASGQDRATAASGQQRGGLPDGLEVGGQPNGTEFRRPQNGAAAGRIPQNGGQQTGVQPNSSPRTVTSRAARGTGRV